MVESDSALFESGDGHRNLPGGTRRIAALDRAVDQGFLWIIQHGHIFGTSLFGANSRKEIRIEGGRRSEREDLAVVWIHDRDNTALGHRSPKLFLGDILQVEIDCCN